MTICWSNLDTLANAQILGGAYLGSEDGKYVIMARRYRHGDKGRRQYVVHYTTVEYVGSYRTGGANRTLYDGTSLEKAKAAAEVAAGSSSELQAEKSITESIAGMKYLPASAISEISDNGLTGVWIDAEHYRKYHAQLKRGRWVLDGNWSPNYAARAEAAGGHRYSYLVVYRYLRPGQRAGSWAVATGDRPEDVVYRAGSRKRAETWARKHADTVRIEP